MMDACQRPARTPEGRFAPGVSGNPAGRPRGSLNRRTLLERAMREGEDIAAARVLWDAALSGDAVRAQFVYSALEPKRRGPRIPFELPEDPRDLQSVFDTILQRFAAGEISGEEAYWEARFLKERSGIELYFPPRKAAADEVEEADMTEAEEMIGEAAADPEPEEQGDALAADDSSPALAQAELALPRQAEAELPPRACGGGGWGEASDGRISSVASPHPDLPRESRGEAPETLSPEEEFARRDRLWRTGLLGGRELIEHVEEKRRRGEYVNGLQRGFGTIHLQRESL